MEENNPRFTVTLREAKEKDYGIFSNVQFKTHNVSVKSFGEVCTTINSSQKRTEQLIKFICTLRGQQISRMLYQKFMEMSPDSLITAVLQMLKWWAGQYKYIIFCYIWLIFVDLCFIFFNLSSAYSVQLLRLSGYLQL